MFNIPQNVKPSLSLNTPTEVHSNLSQTPITNQTSAKPTSTGIRLSKGQKVSLTNLNPQLDIINVCLGWDVAANTNYDLDVSAFMLDNNDRILGDNYFVFYGQTTSPDNSIVLSEDNKTGYGEGDDETMNITLSKVSPSVSKIVFVVTINEAKKYNYNFGQVSNAFIRVVDCSNNTELVRFDLTDYYSNITSMMVGSLYRHKNEWKFHPIGDGTSDDLEGLCRRYGVNVID